MFSGLRNTQAPFNTSGGRLLLGQLDVAFIGAYALGMFGVGHLAAPNHLRNLLTFGMLASAAAVCAFGMAQFLEIHRLWYFLVIQIVGGVPLPVFLFLDSVYAQHWTRA